MKKIYSTKSTLLTGTLFLTLAGILTRIIGFFYRIFLSRTIGAEGLGIYQLIAPVTAICFAFTAAGIQTSISKFVSMEVGRKNDAGAKTYLSIGLFISLCLSTLCSFFLYHYADFIAVSWLGDKRCTPLLAVLSFSFIPCCIHACINGYYYGLKKTAVPSLCQLTEQFARVGSVYLMYQIAVSEGKSLTLSMVVWGIVCGEAGDFWDDMFGQFFGGNSRGNASGHGFGGDRFYREFTGGNSGSHFRGGRDVEAEVTVDFDEAALGCEKVIRLSGSDGKIQSFKVRIPAGMDDGEQLRLKGKGHTGADGTTGDLFLKIKIRPKNGCERKGLDVYTTVTIPYVTAALGGKARIHTLYGDVDCNIKGGTQDGSKIRLRGKGIVSRKNPSIHGDQYVKVQIQVPKYLSPEAKKKLQEYSMMC